MKIKEKILSFKEFVKNIFMEYPLTMIVIFAYTIFGAAIVDTKLINEEWVEKIFLFGFFWSIGAFFAESIIEKDKIKRAVIYVITAFVSCGFTWYIINSDGKFDFISKLAVSYWVILGSSSIFMIIKKSEKNFSEYLVKVLINFAKVTFVYGILCIGILIIYEIFNLLILDLEGNFIGSIEILLLGFFYFPKMLYSILNLDEEVNGFFKGLVKFVLMSLVTISFAIIYIYIVKILVLREIPKNQIFRILSSLFIVGAPIWTCMQYFKDDSLVYKLSLKLPFAFIPFIFLQIYTIGVRIYANGLTPLRYFCVAFVLFEILYILFYIIKKEKIPYLIIIFNAIVIISLLIPGINMFDLSDLSQAKNLKHIKDKTVFSNEEKEKICGAYNYLLYSDNGKKYIDEILNEKDKEIIKEYNANKSTKSSSSYEYFSLKISEAISIDGYSSLTEVNISSYKVNKKIDFKNLYFSNNDKTLIEVDASNLFKRFFDIYLKNGKQDALDYLKNNNEIIIDENSKIVIKNFSLRYDKSNESVGYFSIDGYYLEK